MRLALLTCLLASLGAGCVRLESSNDRRDGAVPAFDGDVQCDAVPVVADVSPRVLAHGAHIQISGGCLDEARTLTVGGTSVPFTVVDGHIEIDAVPDDLTSGASFPLVVGRDAGQSEPWDVAVAHLVINEVDSLTGDDSHDEHELVELDTDVQASLDLSGYAVIFATGMDPRTYKDLSSVALGSTTSNGRFLIGNEEVSNVQHEIPEQSLGQGAGAHAVAIVQTRTLPQRNQKVSTLDLRVIDAVVYSGAVAPMNAPLLDWCFDSPAARVQVNEGSAGDAEGDSLRRCSRERRDGRVFTPGEPTPDGANGCP
jgi:hypothetical protein